jgi:hypothetical protein
MPTLSVTWEAETFDSEEQRKVGEGAHTGVLTTEHEAATEETPVLLEEVSGRVYQPGDLPPDTQLHAVIPSDAPMPGIVEQARRAGFLIDPGQLPSTPPPGQP